MPNKRLLRTPPRVDPLSLDVRSDGMKTFDKELIQGYVHRTFPVQWVSWWTIAKDKQAREDLGKVLFEGDQLKSITEPSVRNDVTACVLRHTSLMARVEKECHGAIDQILGKIKE